MLARTYIHLFEKRIDQSRRSTQKNASLFMNMIVVVVVIMIVRM
jgi:hypothetical protein